MVICTACGRQMEKVPDWMRSIKVEFVCNNCPKRANLKNIAFLNVENIVAPLSAKASAEAEKNPGKDSEGDDE